MADDVKITFTGDAAGGEKAIAQLERKYDALEAKIKRMKAASKDSMKASADDANSLSGALGTVAARYGSAAVAAGVLVSVTKELAQRNTEYQESLSKFADTFSETAAKFSIQTGLTGRMQGQAVDQLVSALKKTPVTDLQSGMKISQQVASAGFGAEDVASGASAKAVFDLMAGTNAVGRDVTDPRDMVKSIAMVLKGAGHTSPTASQIRGFGGAFSELFDASTVEFSDLKQLGPKMSMLKQFGVDEKTSMSAFSALVDVMGGEKAATGLSSFVSRTATAANVKERGVALASIGLKPEDVAMAEGGMNFFEVSDKLRGALGNVPQEQRNSFLERLYGLEGMPAASYMLSEEGSARIKDFRGRVEEPDVFERNVGLFQESRFARNQRQKLVTDDALRSTLETQPLTFGEVQQGITAGGARARAYGDAAGFTGLQGMAFRSMVSAGEMGFSGLASAAQMVGLAPGDIGFKPADKNAKAGGAALDDAVSILRDIRRVLSEKNLKRPQAKEESN